MDFKLKLPQNKKETALYMGTISIISVNIIAPLITCFELEFSLETWNKTLKIIPFVWLSVIILVLLTQKPASILKDKIVHSNDSFGSQITINILCNVLIMSVLLTVIAPWISSKSINTEAILMFFYRWPRNFAISLGVELIIAQPIARQVMSLIHKGNLIETENY